MGKVYRFYAAEDYCQDGVALFEASIIPVGCTKLWKSIGLQYLIGSEVALAQVWRRNFWDK